MSFKAPLGFLIAQVCTVLIFAPNTTYQLLCCLPAFAIGTMCWLLGVQAIGKPTDPKGAIMNPLLLAYGGYAYLLTIIGLFITLLPHLR